jgi:hypothetical protein
MSEVPLYQVCVPMLQYKEKLQLSNAGPRTTGAEPEIIHLWTSIGPYVTIHLWTSIGSYQIIHLWRSIGTYVIIYLWKSIVPYVRPSEDPTAGHLSGNRGFVFITCAMSS